MIEIHSIRQISPPNRESSTDGRSTRASIGGTLRRKMPWASGLPGTAHVQNPAACAWDMVWSGWRGLGRTHQWFDLLPSRVFENNMDKKAPDHSTIFHLETSAKLFDAPPFVFSSFIAWNNNLFLWVLPIYFSASERSSMPSSHR